MRWLVTGGAGFLGINLVRHLLARGDDVVSLAREPFDYPERPRLRVADHLRLQIVLHHGELAALQL